jgi:hypothetical protein
MHARQFSQNAETDLGEQEREYFDGLFRAWGRLRSIDDPSHMFYASTNVIGRLYKPGYRQMSAEPEFADSALAAADEAFCAALADEPGLRQAFELYYRPRAKGADSPHGNIKRCAQWMRTRERTFAMSLELAKARVVRAVKNNI